MEGPGTDALFGCAGCKVRVAYLNGSSELFAPVELIQFLEPRLEVSRPDLQKTSISEICCHCEDINKLYQHLKEHQVECLSEPQLFDFTRYGFGKSMLSATHFMPQK